MLSLNNLNNEIKAAESEQYTARLYRLNNNDLVTLKFKIYGNYHAQPIAGLHSIPSDCPIGKCVLAHFTDIIGSFCLGCSYYAIIKLGDRTLTGTVFVEVINSEYVVLQLGGDCSMRIEY